MSDEELTYDQKVALELEKLRAYHESIREEFANVDEKTDKSIVAGKARKQILDLVPNAASSIAWLIQHADSESVRAGLSKWVMQVAMDEAKDGNEENEFAALLDRLSRDTSKTAS